MIRGIHHPAINTANLDRLLTFYRDVVGFQQVSEVSWTDRPSVDEMIGVPGSAGRLVMLRAGNCFLELFEFAAPAARDLEPLRPHDRGYTHICLDVADIEAAFDRLTLAGATFNGRPRDLGPYRAVYGKDPDGNVLELLEVTPGEKFELPLSS